MAIIQLKNVSIKFGHVPLLDSVDLLIEPRSRVCIVGRNGEGKSTLLKIIDGEIDVDSGEVIRNQGITCARLPQEVPRNLTGSVTDILTDCLTDLEEDWQKKAQVHKVLSMLELDGETDVNSLSGGWKRRVLLGTLLVREPDVLLLDEPTNHLDMSAIDWLVGLIKSYPGIVILISHDRWLLQSIATDIVDIDRGHLRRFHCDYDTYIKRKQDVLEAEAQQDALFDKRLAQEEVWIRQGIKARRTRNEGRVRSLEKMRRERAARRTKTGKAEIQIHKGERSGKRVIDAENIRYSIDGKQLINNFSCLITRGDKIGIIGPNGVGKSTLVKLLLGELQPDSGNIQMGENCKILYFDQLRTLLNENQTVQDNIGEGASFVTINGKQQHIISYLQDFLFSPERARTPVKALSGGERNRVLLAKLFTKPANVIVLDEPTNDLDIETLEMLEAQLVNFHGTVLLISHDRAFIDNVVTSVFIFEGNGKIVDYVGGYRDYQLEKKKTEPPKKTEVPKKPQQKNKLSYNEQRELKQLPKKIETLEKKIATMHQEMAKPDFYQQSEDIIAAKGSELKTLEENLQLAYERWETLESS